MKRIFLFLGTILLIVALAAFPASAAELSVALTPSAETVAPGDTVTVTLALADAPEAQSVGVSLTLPAGMETVSSEWLAGDLTLSHYDKEKNKGVATREGAGDYTGDLLRLTLRVSEDCTDPALTAAVTLKQGTAAVASASASLTLGGSTPAATSSEAPPAEPSPFPWAWFCGGAALLLIAALVAFLLLKKRKSSSQ